MLENKNPTVYLGFITFGSSTAPYLPFFLNSLAAQTYQDFKIVVYDNTPLKDIENLNVLPDTIDVFKSDANIGFSRAYNKLISEAIEAQAKYFFVINPDTYLKPDVLELLVRALEADDTLSSVCPKILKWNFVANEMTNIIDSCGLALKSGLVFSDLGQGLIDENQYKQANIIGASGAAGLFRLSSLASVAEGDNYFDENFFMYKEDCDLAYRLYLNGFITKLVPEALVYHDRTAMGGKLWQKFINRRQRSRAIKSWSFINQHFLFIKYWSKQTLLSRLVILFRVKLLFLNAFIFEQYLLKCYQTIFSQAKNLKRYH